MTTSDTPEPVVSDEQLRRMIRRGMLLPKVLGVIAAISGMYLIAMAMVAR